MQGLIKNAQAQRFQTQDNNLRGEYIEVTEQWQAQLEAIPFISCKFILTNYFYRNPWQNDSTPQAEEQTSKCERQTVQIQCA